MSDRTIYFRLDETLRVAEATARATSHHDSFVDQGSGTKTGPALMWVKDAGTYLMSNATPRPDSDVIYGRAFAADGLLLKQPDDSRSPAWDEVWNTTREICGGDDFAEYFELGELLPRLRAALADGWTHLVLAVTDETVDLSFWKARPGVRHERPSTRSPRRRSRRGLRRSVPPARRSTTWG